MKGRISMGLLTLAVALTVASNLLYHVWQKSIPGGAHPLMSLTVTYLVALLVTLLLFPFYPGGGPTWRSIGSLNWTSIAVGVAIVGVEMRFCSPIGRAGESASARPSSTSLSPCS
jgi:hypothetical protein